MMVSSESAPGGLWVGDVQSVVDTTFFLVKVQNEHNLWAGIHRVYVSACVCVCKISFISLNGTHTQHEDTRHEA